jgi:hypothetical protein
MSTRIHVAWRVRRDRLNDLIDILRKPVLHGFFKLVRGVMDAVKPEAIADEMAQCERVWSYNPERFKERKPHMELVARWHKAEELFRKPGSGGPILDVEAGINVWFHKGFAYVIPYGSTHEFMRRAKWDPHKRLPAWVQDFSFWNNADPPEDVSPAEWAKRERTWNKVCLEGDLFNKYRLHHEFTNLQPGLGTDTCLLVMKQINVWFNREKA